MADGFSEHYRDKYNAIKKRKEDLKNAKEIQKQVASDEEEFERDTRELLATDKKIADTEKRTAETIDKLADQGKDLAKFQPTTLKKFQEINDNWALGVDRDITDILEKVAKRRGTAVSSTKIAVTRQLDDIKLQVAEIDKLAIQVKQVQQQVGPRQLSGLERVFTGLSSLSAYNALWTATGREKGAGSYFGEKADKVSFSPGTFAKQYAKDVLNSIRSAVVGKDYAQKRSASQDLGPLLGFLVDAGLDPASYGINPLAKAFGWGVKGVGKGVGKVAPTTWKRNLDVFHDLRKLDKPGININAMTLKELEAIPGIGKATAEKIFHAREGIYIGTKGEKTLADVIGKREAKKWSTDEELSKLVDKKMGELNEVEIARISKYASDSIAGSALIGQKSTVGARLEKAIDKQIKQAKKVPVPAPASDAVVRDVLGAEKTIVLRSRENLSISKILDKKISTLNEEETEQLVGYANALIKQGSDKNKIIGNSILEKVDKQTAFVKANPPQPRVVKPAETVESLFGGNVPESLKGLAGKKLTDLSHAQLSAVENLKYPGMTFSSMDDLLKIPGINKSVVDKLRKAGVNTDAFNFDNFLENFTIASNTGTMPKFLADSEKNMSRYGFNSGNFFTQFSKPGWGVGSQNPALRAFDWTQGLYKKGIMMLPQAWTRNFSDAAQKNWMSGVRTSDYNTWRKIQKGGDQVFDIPGVGKQTADQILENARKYGVTGQVGWTDITAGGKGPISKAMNWGMQTGENWSRGPQFWRELQGGKGYWDAAKKVTAQHYQYGDAFSTPFEKGIMARLDPFWKYDKSNTLFWPQAVERFATKASFLGKAQEATTPEEYRRLNKPKFLGDMLNIDHWSGFGGSYEDWARLIADPLKESFQKVGPLLKGAIEIPIDWNSFKEMPISKDKSAKGFEFLPQSILNALGYQSHATGSGTINPYLKYLIEAAGARGWNVGKGIATEGSGWDWAKLVTSVKPREYSDKTIKFMNSQSMRRTGSPENVLMSALYADSVANAASLDSDAPLYMHGLGTTAKMRKDWAGETGLPEYQMGATTKWNGDERDTRYRQQMVMRLKDQITKVQIEGIADPAARVLAQAQAEIAAAQRQVDFGNLDPALAAAMVKAAGDRYALNRPRAVGEAGRFSEGTLRSYQKLPIDYFQDFNKAQQTLIEFTSKNAEINAEGRQGSDKARAQLQQRLFGIQALRQQGIEAPEALKQRERVAIEAYNRAMDEVQREILKSRAEVAEEIAEGMLEGVEKFEAKKVAALLTFDASDKSTRLKEEGRLDLHEQMMLSISQKWDRKKYDWMVEQGHKHAALQDQIARDQIRAADSALKVQFEAGKLSIDQYFDARKEAISRNFDATIKEYTDKIAKLSPDDQKNKDILTGKLSQVIADRATALNTEDYNRIGAQRQLNTGINKYEQQMSGLRTSNKVRTEGTLFTMTDQDIDFRTKQKLQFEADQTAMEEQLKGDPDKKLKMERWEYEERKKMALDYNEFVRGQYSQTASTMGEFAGSMSTMWEQFYNASGQKSREFFVLMKTAQMAEAIMNGISATIAAYDKGTKAGNIYLGAAWAAVAAATTGAQIGMLAAQTFATGGEVKGGSGTRDDVPVLAMGGEYFHNKSAVNYYGLDVMEAINRRAIPRESFNVPSMPKRISASRHYAEGGYVPEAAPDRESSTLNIVNFVDKDLMDQYMATSAGQDSVVNVIALRRGIISRIIRGG
jgi:ribosomal protein S13